MPLMSRHSPGQEPEDVTSALTLTIRLALLTIMFAAAWTALYLLRTHGH